MLKLERVIVAEVMTLMRGGGLIQVWLGEIVSGWVSPVEDV